jgi:hypothetical protein
MPTERLSMRRIRQVLQLHFGVHASSRVIAREVGVGRTTVQDYLTRASVAGLGWPLSPDLTDEALEQRLFPAPSNKPGIRRHPEPDWALLVREMKRPGVSLLILWEEYDAVHPQGYGYSRFCELYRAFERRLSPTMRQTYVAGHKAFVDYSGKKVPIVDPFTGEVRMAEIFVAVLGASNLTYAEATWTQTLPDWIGAHVRMFQFYGAAPRRSLGQSMASTAGHRGTHAAFGSHDGLGLHNVVISWLNPTPHAITVYASDPASPRRPQHSLPGGSLRLPGRGLAPVRSRQLRLAHHVVTPCQRDFTQISVWSWRTQSGNGAATTQAFQVGAAMHQQRCSRPAVVSEPIAGDPSLRQTTDIDASVYAAKK